MDNLKIVARSCLKKYTYYKRNKATSAAKKMKKKYEKDYIIYKCHFCEHMHMATYRDGIGHISKQDKGGRVVYSTNGVF